MDKELVKSLNLPFRPSIGANLNLFESENRTFLLFPIVDDKKEAKSYTIAKFEFLNCIITKFGYPNDEGIVEHELYNKGLSNSPFEINEVINSNWIKEIEKKNEDSCKRIAAERNKQVGMHKKNQELRHFIIVSKEKTFECIAKDYKYELTTESLGEIFKKIFIVLM